MREKKHGTPNSQARRLERSSGGGRRSRRTEVSGEKSFGAPKAGERERKLKRRRRQQRKSVEERHNKHRAVHQLGVDATQLRHHHRLNNHIDRLGHPQQQGMRHASRRINSKEATGVNDPIQHQHQQNHQRKQAINMSGSICALGPPQEGSRLIRRTPRNNTASNTASNRRVSYGKELAMQSMGNHGTATGEKNSDPSTDSVLFASLMLSGLSCYAGHATHDQLIAAEKSPRPHTHTRVRNHHHASVHGCFSSGNPTAGFSGKGCTDQ